MTPKKRAMMTGIPNAVSPAIGATEAIFDEDYWEQKAKRYLSERDAALTLAERREVQVKRLRMAVQFELNSLPTMREETRAAGLASVADQIERNREGLERIVKSVEALDDIAAAPPETGEAAHETISRLTEGLDAIDVEVREAERCRDAGDWGQVGAMLHEVRRVLDNTLAGTRHPWAEFADDVAVPPASEDAGGAGNGD